MIVNMIALLNDIIRSIWVILESILNYSMLKLAHIPLGFILQRLKLYLE